MWMPRTTRHQNVGVSRVEQPQNSFYVLHLIPTWYLKHPIATPRTHTKFYRLEENSAIYTWHVKLHLDSESAIYQLCGSLYINPLPTKKEHRPTAENTLASCNITTTMGSQPQYSQEPIRVAFDGFLFDMDGTIIDSTPAVIKHWHK